MVFGWVFVGHQLGAAVAAWGAGRVRTLMLTYNPALFAAGAACLVAAGASCWYGGRRRRLSPQTPKRPRDEVWAALDVSPW